MNFSLGCALALLLVGLSQSASAALLKDDFNDGNANGWTEYDPLSALGAPFARFSVVNGAYRIQSLPSPSPAQVGPGRAGAYRTDATLSSFYVAADVVNYDPELRQAFGLLARVQNPGLAQTTGYAFTYDTSTGPTKSEVDLSRIDGEDPNDIPTEQASNIYFEPGKSYRLVFIGNGGNLEGRVYELPDLETPKLRVTGFDDRYTQGYSGFVVFDNMPQATPGPTDATFDNFLAADVEPIKLTISVDEWGGYWLSWPAKPAGYRLQQRSALGTGEWMDVTEGVFQSGDLMLYTVFLESPNQFFRLVYP